jgi:undecaprenyl-diphosphatase
MEIWQAITYGVVQGLTEFIPISSTAHLALLAKLCGWPDPGAAFTAVIQGGTLLAAILYFGRDIGKILKAVWVGLLTMRPVGTPEARLGWMIVVGTIPIVACGILFEKAIETDTLRNLWVISGALIGLALVLGLAEWWTRRQSKNGVEGLTTTTMNWAPPIWVGLAQAVALVPGASRSGVTITAGLFMGLTRAEAARFAFLLSLPSVFAAMIKKLYTLHRDGQLASESQAVNLLTATLVAGIVGYAAIWGLMTFLKTRTTLVFVVYRLLLGGLLLGLLFAGRITADIPTH